MDEEKQPIDDAQTPITQQPFEEWQAELSAAIRMLYKEGFFFKRRSIWIYWMLLGMFLFFTWHQFVPSHPAAFESTLYAGIAIVVGLFILWALYVSILRHRVQIKLSNADLVDNLVKGKLQIESIQEHVPKLYRYRLVSRLGKGLAKRLEILAENLDWYLSEPRFVFRVDWPCGCYVVAYVIAFMLFTVGLVSLGESAIAFVNYVVQSNTSSRIILIVSLPFLFSLNIARKAVYAEELFRAVGFKMREDFFSATDERKGGAEVFKDKLAELVALTGLLQSLGFGFIVALPIFLAMILADSMLIAPLTATYAILMQAFIIRAALLEKAIHRTQTHDALARSSMAIKLLSGELDPNGFTLAVKWVAPLFGAPLKRASLLRTAVMAALDPAELLQLPRRQSTLRGLNLGWQLGFAGLVVCYFVGGIAVGISWQRILVMVIAVPVLSWLCQYILVSYARQGARVTEFLVHLQDRIRD
jgi:hypothetical protein